MKRTLALLSIVGTLIALAVPASSFGAVEMWPSNVEFYMYGPSNSSPPTIKTAYGSCPITYIKSKTPQLGGKYPSMPATLIAPNSTCSSGTSISFSGKWTLKPYSMTSMVLSDEAHGLTMRFASVPGCKLVTASIPTTVLWGRWTNGSGSGSTNYRAEEREIYLTWENDSPSTCSKAGTREYSGVYQSPGTPGFTPVLDGAAPEVRTIEVPN
jgi:hypothetical protein